MIERDRRRRGTGTLLNLGAAVAYSAAGLFTRVIDLDVWTLLFWRGLFSALFLGGLLWALHRGRTWTVLRQLGWPGFAVALASTSGMVFYVHALRQTTVADVAVIYAHRPSSRQPWSGSGFASGRPRRRRSPASRLSSASRSW